MNENETKEKESYTEIIFSVTKRHVSYLFPLLLMLLGGAFMAGFFFAHYYMVHDFVVETTRNSFADQFNNSLRLIGLMKTVESAESEPEQVIMTESSEEILSTNNDVKNNEEIRTVGWQAAIFGGSRSACEACAFKMKRDFGVECTIMQRSGRTSRGKETEWFQVVTPLYQERKVLDDLLYILEKNGGVRKPMVWYQGN